MNIWNKKPITSDEVNSISARFKIDKLTAAILARRGVTEGKDIEFFLEDNERYMHNPFLFNNMEDVVDRILQAKDEEEKVLIFGDRDVDGITSTTVLYDYLTSIGIDVQAKLPGGTDPYGLNLRAIDDFEKDYGSLIITVDCGISNVKEIAYAAEKGMDVIVLDHHNPPDALPEPAIIIDPKCADSGYPFKDISGCAVAYKVVSALRFALSDLYKNEVALFTVRDEKTAEGAFVIDIMKTVNLVEKSSITEEVMPGTSVSATRLPSYLRGQQIFVWDEKRTKAALSNIFGTGTDFNCYDFRNSVKEFWPSFGNMTLGEMRKKSKIAVYNPEFDTEIKAFFNIFVTYHDTYVSKKFPGNSKSNERDLQLVALAALADIMPLKNENRIFVRRGIDSMNKGHSREGLLELLAIQNMLEKKITSTDLSWNINPVLNATGRLGQPEVGLGIFLTKDADKRREIVNEVIAMNTKRKQFGMDAWEIGNPKAKDSIAKHGGKLCVIMDERINRGVSGTLAAKLVQTYNVPAMAMTVVENTVIGSMRSCRGFDVTTFLDAMDQSPEDGAPLFISHGGHNYAAGFSFDKSRLEHFEKALDKLVPTIRLSGDESETIEIDAELTGNELTPEILNLIDRFEPYGEANRELIFLSKELKIDDFLIMGKESQHLKLTLNTGKSKWPAIFWSGAENIHKEFDKGDCIDVIYTIERNTYNGNTTPQMKIIKAWRSV
ncbi:MAG: single-stranded-DNA-specific exonuclease RecJ [Treponema sp.]|nr:single-stranded-DNA-specific exonuclease RecJ [Treponema sp.]